MDMKIKSDVLYFENNLLHAYNFMLYFICNRASNISYFICIGASNISFTLLLLAPFSTVL